MNTHKIVLFALSVIIYFFYSVHMWISKNNVRDEIIKDVSETLVVKSTNDAIQIPKNNVEEIKVKREVKKVIPLYLENACSVLEIFTQKPVKKKKQILKMINEFDSDKNTLTVIGITVFLIILTVNAILDVIKAKEEERAKKKLNPDGERRKSLSEFANKRTLRRESSKFNIQLFQIAESNSLGEEDKPPKRQSRLYRRGDSTNSYLSEKNQTEAFAPASINDCSAGETKLMKRQSVAKLFGARPSPMMRRSSFPALPINPDIQNLIQSHRQSSFDSDDEGDGKGRRIGIVKNLKSCRKMKI